MEIKNLSKAVYATGRSRTIHQCLITLGAKRKDVYLESLPAPTYLYSIYNRYSIDELYYMVKTLYKESIKKYHIDKHFNSKRRKFYEKKTVHINEAHQKALKILRCKGNLS